jgi:hypothetical protein
VVNAKLAKNVALKSVSRSIYIREIYDFTRITIFESIGVDSGPKLGAIIFTSAGNDVQKISLWKIESLSPPWVFEVSTLIRNDRILGCVLKEFSIWVHIAINLEKTLIFIYNIDSISSKTIYIQFFSNFYRTRTGIPR